MSKKSGSKSTPKPMTVADAARIQSTTAKKHGGKTPTDSFAARAERAAAHNALDGEK